MGFFSKILPSFRRKLKNSAKFLMMIEKKHQVLSKFCIFLPPSRIIALRIGVKKLSYRRFSCQYIVKNKSDAFRRKITFFYDICRMESSANWHSEWNSSNRTFFTISMPYSSFQHTHICVYVHVAILHNVNITIWEITSDLFTQRRPYVCNNMRDLLRERFLWIVVNFRTTRTRKGYYQV